MVPGMFEPMAPGRYRVQAGRGCVVDPVLPEEERQNRNLVRYARARADHGVALAPRVPHDPEARGEVVVVAVIRRVYVDAHLLEPDFRVEVADQVVLLFDDSAQVVAHAVVDRESRADAPVVLYERPKGVDRDLPSRIADEYVSAIGNPARKSSSGVLPRMRVAAVLESDPALAAPVAQVVGRAVPHFGAEAVGVLADVVRDVVDELPRLVGRGQQRPAAVASELREASDQDGRHAEVDFGRSRPGLCRKSRPGRRCGRRS